MLLTNLLYYYSAEKLDNLLTAVQRDHEHISQLEERKIRDDAAREEAKRKEKAIQEEKLRQERIKAEEEVLSSCMSIDSSFWFCDIMLHDYCSLMLLNIYLVTLIPYLPSISSSTMDLLALKGCVA